MSVSTDCRVSAEPRQVSSPLSPDISAKALTIPGPASLSSLTSMELSTGKRLSAKDYTVGWICALAQVEQPAAIKMLDERHDPIPQPEHDDNTYFYGSLGGHNVAIACLPLSQPGLVSAARVVEPLPRSFPNMKIHLLVGIGGGIPMDPPAENALEDIRLGDVVIGYPKETGAPAVIQYNMIRDQKPGRSQQIGYLDKPDRRLVGALGALESKRMLGESDFATHLKRLTGLEKDFTRPTNLEDKLYKRAMEPLGSKRRAVDKLVDRKARESLDPVYHLGQILSGDSVMKNGQRRDGLKREYPLALCFEMEAAGVLDQTHCLVIRGIADYSDYRKDWGWQPYAAGTAAAFARELLLTIAHNAVKSLDHAPAASNIIPWDPPHQLKTIDDFENVLKMSEVERRLQLVSSLDPRNDHDEVRASLNSRYWGSGKWLISHEDFVQWRYGPSSVLILQGHVGVGKSSLTSIVVEQLLSDPFESNVAFFYCSQGQNEAVGILRSIVAQMSRINTDAGRNVFGPNIFGPVQNWVSRRERMQKTDEERMSKMMSLDECKKFLKQIMEFKQKGVIIIDGIDECHPPKELLDCLAQIHHQCETLRLFISSRDGTVNMNKFRNARMISDLKTDSDLQAYIKCEIANRQKETAMTSTQAIELESLLSRRAQGMFQWVKLQLDVVFNPEYESLHRKDFEHHLQSLRSFSGHPDLNTVYRKILSLNTKGQKVSTDFAVKALQWMLVSFKPLKIETLVQAVGRVSQQLYDDDVNETFIMRICRNFIMKTEWNTVKFTHKSVKDFLRGSGLPEVFDEEFLSERCHAQVARTCIHFLLTLQSDSTWGHLPVDPDIKESAVLKLSSFELYASLFWTKHCAKAGNLRESGDLREAFRRLIGGTNTMIASLAFQKWNSLLKRYFSSINNTDYKFEGTLRRQLGDSFSMPANPIFSVCICGFSEILRPLLNHKPTLANSENEVGKSVLYLACENGQSDVARLLIAKTADIHISHDIWGSIAQAAAWGGNLDIFEHLCDQKVDLNSEPGFYGRVFDAAIRSGNEELVSYALDKGVHVYLPPMVWNPFKRAWRTQPLVPGDSDALNRLTMKVRTTFDPHELNFDLHKPLLDASLHNANTFWNVRHVERLDPVIARIRLIERMQLANVRREEMLRCARLKFKRTQKIQIPRMENIAIRVVSEDPLMPYIKCLSDAVPTELSPELVDSYWDAQQPVHYMNVPELSWLEDETPCPYCHGPLSPSDQQSGAWERHIFRDLRAYICPFADCNSKGRLYQDYEEWDTHLTNAHAQQRQAYRDGHTEGWLLYNPNWRISASQQEAYEQEDSCPICCLNLVPFYSAGVESRARHIARHMEKAASFVKVDDRVQGKASAGSTPSQSDAESIEAWSSDEEDAVSSNRGDEDDDKKEPERSEENHLQTMFHPLTQDNDDTLAVYRRPEIRKSKYEGFDRKKSRIRSLKFMLKEYFEIELEEDAPVRHIQRVRDKLAEYVKREVMRIRKESEASNTVIGWWDLSNYDLSEYLENGSHDGSMHEHETDVINIYEVSKSTDE